MQNRARDVLAPLFLLGAVTYAICSCGGWQKTARSAASGMFNTVRLAKTIGVEVTHAKCKALALKCAAAPSRCGEFKACQTLRHKIENLAIGANKAIAGLLLAIEVGEETGYQAKLEAARAKIKELEALLAREGVI